MRLGRSILAVLFSVMFVFGRVTPARAGGDDVARNPIVYVGVAVANIAYIPAKLVYSVLGGATGTLAYAVTVGNVEATQAVWDVTCRGTYLVTPDMLEGKDDIRFKGP